MNIYLIALVNRVRDLITRTKGLDDIHDDVDLVKTQTDRLAGGETTGTHAHANNVNWQTVFTITTTTRIKVHAIWLDFINLTQNMNMRLSYQVDGTNFRIFWSSTWLSTDVDGVLINVPRAIANDLRLELQSAVAEGAIRNIPYEIITEDME